MILEVNVHSMTVGKVLVVTELSPYGDLLKYLQKVAAIGLGAQEG